jgi:putative ABC transport system permease protein
VFYLGYMLSELGRRMGRTFLTALGLAVGVGLVVTVNALSTGLDRAQAEVLKPLTGVGTDLSVTRPLNLEASSSDSGSGSSGGGPRFGPQLSDEERKQLEQENGSSRFGLRNLGKPGTKFTRDDFLATAQLSFPASKVTDISSLSGVKAAAGGLTLTSIHISGTVPESQPSEQTRGTFVAPAPGQGGPRNIDADSFSVSGVDQTHPELGAITSGQLTTGRYFSSSATSREAILNVSYAQRKNLGVGDTFKLGGNTYTVVGLARTPLGGQSSDVYVKLSQLQAMSGRKGRVNTVYVRTTTAENVSAVARHIRETFDGASVTTAADLAKRVSGSLVDAKNLSSKLGTALEIVGLAAAFLIAALLTLASVTKRIRELGTLKALGWRQRLVVRQITGESLIQGLLGGALGIVIGIGGAALVSAFAPTLEATVESAAQQGGPIFFGDFGQGAVSSGSTNVVLEAPVSIGLLALAVALALLGGLLSGAVGGLRAARLRPADALRHID